MQDQDNERLAAWLCTLLLGALSTAQHLYNLTPATVQRLMNEASKPGVLHLMVQVEDLALNRHTLPLAYAVPEANGSWVVGWYGQGGWRNAEYHLSDATRVPDYLVQVARDRLRHTDEYAAYIG